MDKSDFVGLFNPRLPHIFENLSSLSESILGTFKAPLKLKQFKKKFYADYKQRFEKVGQRKNVKLLK